MAQKKINKKNLWQMIKFALVGALNTLVDTGIFVLLNTVLGVNILVAQFFGYAGGIVNSYFFNSSWTFKGSKTRGEIIKFIALNLVTGLISVMAIGFFQSIIHLDTLFGMPVHEKLNNFLAKICTVAFTLVINFIGSKFWVFRRSAK